MQMSNLDTHRPLTMSRIIKRSLSTDNSRPRWNIKLSTPISRLPVELLLTIFRIVYVDSFSPSYDNLFTHLVLCESVGNCLSGPYETKWRERDDIISPILFPYALASVCTTWRDVMFLVPEFWTRIIILIDSELFSLSDIRLQLESSRNLSIDVTITKRSAIFEGREVDENRLVGNVTALLHPHLQRCETIHYDVLHSSSLPTMSLDLSDSMPELRQLRLESTQCSNAYQSASRRSVYPRNVLRFPALEKLVIDGWNFIELYRNDPQWISHITGQLRLSISHYIPSGIDGGRFSFHDAFEFMSRIPRLISLTLHDIEFDFELVMRLDRFLVDEHFASLSSIELNGLSSRLTTGILAYLELFYLDSITIIRCPLSEVGYPPHSPYLTLEDLPCTEDMCRYIAYWSGVELYISDCPTFDDSILEMLGSTWGSEDGDGADLCAPRLFQLSLHNCTSFSTTALRSMVEARQAVTLGFTEVTVNDNPPLSYISVSGSAPKIFKEDKEWLENNLDCFDWSPEKEV